MATIYKLSTSLGEEVYVGSTIQSLSIRMRNHIADAKRKCCSSYILFEKYGRDNITISCLEENVLEADRYIREQYWIDQHATAINTRHPYRSTDEALEFYKIRKHQYTREKKECECGMILTKSSFLEHTRSERHKKRMETSDNILYSQISNGTKPSR